LFALVSSLTHDNESGSSRIGPAPAAIAQQLRALALICDTALNAASEGGARPEGAGLTTTPS
jgi:hypothetical protein